MATQAEIRQRVYDLLYGNFPTERPYPVQLAGAYNNSTTAIDVPNTDLWDVGDIAMNPATSEKMLVVGIDEPNDEIDVVRAWEGTTVAASSGSADLLYKNPRFDDKKVDDAIEATLRMFEGWDIHTFGNGEITRADPKEFYELTETDILDHIGILRVFEVDENYEFPRALPYRFQYSLGTDATEYSVGYGVHVLDWGTRNNGEKVFFTYAKRIDDVADLLARQEELVVVGAVAILMGGTIAPATHDPGARTDRTIQPGQTSRDVRHFQGRFYTEARIEAAQLSVERQRFLREHPKSARARRWRG